MSLLGMVSGLVRANVEFVVIGGVAARAHGSTRITEDLDVCYDPAPDNRSRLGRLLDKWHAYPRGVESGLPFVMDEKTLGVSPVLTLITDQGALDLFDEVEGVGSYSAVRRSSVEIEASGVRFRVLDLAALLKAKRATGRPKDLDQIPELEAIRELRRKKGG